jgi:hypothetical protein
MAASFFANRSSSTARVWISTILGLLASVLRLIVTFPAGAQTGSRAVRPEPVLSADDAGGASTPQSHLLDEVVKGGR